MKKSRFWFIYAAVFFIFGVNTSFCAESLESSKLQKTCFKKEKEGELPWSFCFFETPESTNKDVIYFFHGLTEDENVWGENDNFASMLRQTWSEQKKDAPLVVSVSFGPLWLLIKKNELPDSGLLDLFLGQIFPMIDKQVEQKGHTGKKILLGKSMGGLNAFQMYFYGPQVFSKVALVCPAISELSPFATEDEANEFIERVKADPEKVYQAMTLGRYFIPSEEIWQKVSPLHLVQKMTVNPELKFYVTSSLQDDYGFYGGTESFAKAAKENHNIAWRPLVGNHCAMDIYSLAKFLVQ